MELVNITAKRATTDSLGRYYTTDGASEALVKQLLHHKPRRVLDLGAGGGALTLAARREWTEAEFVTVDIDIQSQHAIQTLMNISNDGKHVHYHFDALSLDLPDLLGGPSKHADVAICNPPFIKPAWKKDYEKILEDAGLSGCYATIKDASADVLFLAQNLRLIRDDGSLGIIVPDSIVSGKKHVGLRRALVENHRIDSVIKLPRNVFVGTDAQAYIITLTKHGENNERVELKEINSVGDLCAPIFLSKKDAYIRLDFGFNALLQSVGKDSKPLGDLVYGIWRGNVSSKSRLDFRHKIFHLTDFPARENSDCFKFPKHFYSESGPAMSGAVIARAGDILLARVGRNLEDKVCLIADGVAAVTDCVYVIRPKDEYREAIFESLSSELGRQWIGNAAHGVSARQLPKCDLINFPVSV